MTDWRQYRIFARVTDKGTVADYGELLRQVVSPLVTEFDSELEHFHVLAYANRYGTEAEEVTDRLQLDDDDWVSFIRLRLGVRNTGQQLEDRLRFLCQEAPGCAGLEAPMLAYNPDADLGGRFGATRTTLVMNIMEAASRLALAYATDGQPYDPHPQGQGGTGGVVHLVANTLQYSIYTGAIQDWLRIRVGGERLGP